MFENFSTGHVQDAGAVIFGLSSAQLASDTNFFWQASASVWHWAPSRKIMDT
jgi:hypothetical protein